MSESLQGVCPSPHLEQDGDGLGEGTFFEEKVLVLSQDGLMREPGLSQAGLGEFADVVHRHAAAGQRNSFHVPAFGSAQSHDPFLGKHVQGERVDALLVD